MRRTIFEPEHQQFRDTVRDYITLELAPHSQEWEAAGIVDRSAYVAAGKHGVIGFNVPEEFGGGEWMTSASTPWWPRSWAGTAPQRRV